jgi:hypothetical protein
MLCFPSVGLALRPQALMYECQDGFIAKYNPCDLTMPLSANSIARFWPFDGVELVCTGRPSYHPAGCSIYFVL